MNDKSKGWLNYWVDPKSWTFKGDFEGIYRDFDDPWLCQQRNASIERRFIMILLGGRRYLRLLDIGCGLGGFTETLRQSSGADFACGVDVSPTAVAKAAERYHKCQFVATDITQAPLPRGEGGLPYDLILLQEVIWYLLPHLPDVLRSINESLAAEGVFFIEQCFPNNQKFGREYLTSPDELIEKYLRPAGFKIDIQFRQILSDESILLIKLTK